MTVARRLPPPAISEEDPLWQKFVKAPVDSEPAPSQEVRGLAEAKAGGFVKGAVVTVEITRRAHAKTPLSTR